MIISVKLVVLFLRSNHQLIGYKVSTALERYQQKTFSVVQGIA